MPASRIITGSRLFTYINNRIFGKVVAFNITAENNKKEIRTVDVQFPLEIAPTTTSFRGTLQVLRLMGDSGAQGSGLAAEQINSSREKYFTLLITERLSDLPVFKADFCSLIRENWSVNAGNILMGTIEFTGVIYTNESSIFSS